MNRFQGISKQWLRNKEAVFRELFGTEDDDCSSVETRPSSPILGWFETLPPPISLPDLIIEIEPQKKTPACPDLKTVELVFEFGPSTLESTEAISQTFEEELPELISLEKELNTENQRDVGYEGDISALSDDSRGEPVKRKKRTLKKQHLYHRDKKKRQ